MEKYKYEVIVPFAIGDYVCSESYRIPKAEVVGFNCYIDSQNKMYTKLCLKILEVEAGASFQDGSIIDIIEFRFDEWKLLL